MIMLATRYGLMENEQEVLRKETRVPPEPVLIVIASGSDMPFACID